MAAETSIGYGLPATPAVSGAPARDEGHGVDAVGALQPADRELGAREGDEGAVRLGPVGGGDDQAARGDRCRLAPRRPRTCSWPRRACPRCR